MSRLYRFVATNGKSNGIQAFEFCQKQVNLHGTPLYFPQGQQKRPKQVLTNDFWQNNYRRMSRHICLNRRVRAPIKIENWWHIFLERGVFLRQKRSRKLRVFVVAWNVQQVSKLSFSTKCDMHSLRYTSHDIIVVLLNTHHPPITSTVYSSTKSHHQEKGSKSCLLSPTGHLTDPFT